MHGMPNMTEKERLLSILSTDQTGRADRVPFVLSSNLITLSKPVTAFRGVQGSAGPGSDPDALVALALHLHDNAGLESLSLPFTMTVESEAYGGETEGRVITSYPLQEVSDFEKLKTGNLFEPPNAEAGSRLNLVAEVISSLAKARMDTPVIADLVAPLSLATSIIDIKTLFKALVREPEVVHDLLGFLTENSIEFARSLVEAGASVFTISDPAATTATLGGGFFEDFSLPYINRLSSVVQSQGIPVIVHICGDIRGIATGLSKLRGECVSLDSNVSISEAGGLLPKKRIMGNVSSSLLMEADPAAALKAGRAALEGGVDILTSSCGVDVSVGHENLRALRSAVESAC